jgi:transposase-like protein
MHVSDIIDDNSSIVHKIRNILEHVRKRDYDEIKTGAQAIYRAEGQSQARAAFRRFRARWLREYGSMVRRLGRDLPSCYRSSRCPGTCGRKCEPPT